MSGSLSGYVKDEDGKLVSDSDHHLETPRNVWKETQSLIQEAATKVNTDICRTSELDAIYKYQKMKRK
jgi:hypothetical protein